MTVTLKINGDKKEWTIVLEDREIVGIIEDVVLGAMQNGVASRLFAKMMIAELIDKKLRATVSDKFGELKSISSTARLVLDVTGLVCERSEEFGLTVEGNEWHP